MSTAANILYQPLSHIVRSFTAGNGLSNWTTYTSDYEIELNGVYDGATAILEKTPTG